MPTTALGLFLIRSPRHIVHFSTLRYLPEHKAATLTHPNIACCGFLRSPSLHKAVMQHSPTPTIVCCRFLRYLAEHKGVMQHPPNTHCCTLQHPTAFAAP